LTRGDAEFRSFNDFPPGTMRDLLKDGCAFAGDFLHDELTVDGR